MKCVNAHEEAEVRALKALANVLLKSSGTMQKTYVKYVCSHSVYKCSALKMPGKL